MSDPFKFVSLDKIRSLNSPIVMVITADEVQGFAEANCGGRLTDDELNEFETAALEDFSCNFYDWLDETIEASRRMAQELMATDRQITELAAQGWTDAEIAKVLMFSVSHVASRRQNLQAPTAVT